MSNGEVKKVSAADCQSDLSTDELDTICSMNAVRSAAKQVSKDLNGLSPDKLDQCVLKIIVTICETIQDNPDLKSKITNDAKDKMLLFIQKVVAKKDIKDYLTKKFIQDTDKNNAEPSSGDAGKEHEGEYVWKAVSDPKSVSAPKFGDLNNLDASSLLDYFSDSFCQHIRSNPNLLSNLIESGFKRFYSYFEKNMLDNVSELLNPFAGESRKILRERVLKYIQGKDTFFDYFAFSDFELTGITEEQYNKLKQDQRLELMKQNSKDRQGVIDSVIKAAEDRILSGKPKQGNANTAGTCSANKPKSDIEQMANTLQGSIQEASALSNPSEQFIAKVRDSMKKENTISNFGSSLISKASSSVGSLFKKKYTVPAKTSGGKNKTHIKKHLQTHHKTLKRHLGLLHK